MHTLYLHPIEHVGDLRSTTRLQMWNRLAAHHNLRPVVRLPGASTSSIDDGIIADKSQSLPAIRSEPDQNLKTRLKETL